MRVQEPQRGAALIMVIFLLVVISAIGAITLRVGTDQSQTAALSMVEVRADAAAFSGVEYGVFRARANDCPASRIVPVPGSGMTGLTVTMNCSVMAAPAGVGTVYEIRATARFGAFGQPDYVQRERTRIVRDNGAGW